MQHNASTSGRIFVLAAANDYLMGKQLQPSDKGKPAVQLKGLEHKTILHTNKQRKDF